jgi:Ca2+-transporting ATPase
MEGSTFREMNHEDLLEMIPKLEVLARSQPQDKHLLVSSLQELGDVVAVTGDGFLLLWFFLYSVMNLICKRDE